MSLVAIDIGTTLIKCGRFANTGLIETWFYRTKDSGSIGGDLLNRIGKDEIAISSVAPIASNNIEEAIARPIFKITAQTQNFIQGFHPLYGADRVCDSVAAYELYAKNKNLAVLAMGTCTVLTTVLANGSVGGGFITLGFHSMINGLKIAEPLTAAVEEADYRNFDLDLGFDTNDQIMNGTALAQIGIVEQWLKLSREKLGEPFISIATGGNAPKLLQNSKVLNKVVDHIDPSLTLKGIQLIYNANRA